MVTAHALTREQARRVAVRAQLLTADRPSDLLDLVSHLTVLQVEPTAAVAPSAEVVVWSRLGSRWPRRELQDAVDDGSLIELRQMLLPAADLALHRAEMACWPEGGEVRGWHDDLRGWFEANDGCRLDILAKLHDEGPLPSSALPDTTVVPWASSGWANDRNVRRMLDLMVQHGEVAVAGTEGRDKLWDLAERVYPDDPVVPLDEALHVRAERRLHALGLARATPRRTSSEPVDVGPVGELARVEGVRGTWRVDPAYLDHVDEPVEPRTTLLSPLDRSIFDRKRMEQLFEFDYQLEMYKPAAARRWGYWAMPILWGEQLVGKLDATAEPDMGVLRVDAVHDDVGFTAQVTAAVDAEIDDLARWLDLEVSRADLSD